MPINIGGTNMDNPQIGGNLIAKIYVGAGIVYCRNMNDLPLPAISQETGHDANMVFVSGTEVTLMCNANDNNHTLHTFEWSLVSDFSTIEETDGTVSPFTGVSSPQSFNITRTATAGSITSVTVYCRVTDEDGGVGTAQTTVSWAQQLTPSTSFNGSEPLAASASGTFTTADFDSNFDETGVSGNTTYTAQMGTNGSGSFGPFVGTGPVTPGGATTQTGESFTDWAPAANTVAEEHGQFQQTRTRSYTQNYADGSQQTVSTCSGTTASSATTTSYNVTVNGTFPNGYFNAGETTSASDIVTQTVPAGTQSGCTPGQQQFSSQSVPTPSTDEMEEETQMVAGTGTYQFEVSGETAPTNGDADMYSVTNVTTNSGFTTPTSYSWSADGGTVSPATGATTTVTWNRDGAGSVTASASFGGNASSTFAESDTLSVMVAAAGPADGSTAAPGIVGSTSVSGGQLMAAVLGFANTQPVGSGGFEWSTTSGFAEGTGTEITGTGGFPITSGGVTWAAPVPQAGTIYVRAWAENDTGRTYGTLSTITT